MCAAWIRNFFELYQPLANAWRVYDNTGKPPGIIAEGRGKELRKVVNDEAWNKFTRQAAAEEEA